MAKKCNACGRFASSTEGVKCVKCMLHYHKACVNIPMDAAVAPGWLCPGCKVQTPRKDNTDNPVRGEKADYMGTIQQSNSECGTCTDLLRELKLMNANMLSFRSDFNIMKDDLSALRNTLESFGGRLDGMEMRIECLEKKCAEPLIGPSSTEVNELFTTIQELKSQLNDCEQEAICNDFVINGIPEEPGQSPVHLVDMIAVKLGVAYEGRDLVLAERAGVRRAPVEGAPAPRPRPLVVRVASRKLRDTFLQAARVRRTLTTEGFGLGAASTRFFVNERLSKFNKYLFYKVREVVRAKNWKFAWTRDGRIYVRRETGRASFRIRTEQDIEKIFGGVDGGVTI